MIVSGMGEFGGKRKLHECLMRWCGEVVFSATCKARDVPMTASRKLVKKASLLG
jgi:hypothetical protein